MPFGNAPLASRFHGWWEQHDFTIPRIGDGEQLLKKKIQWPNQEMLEASKKKTEKRSSIQISQIVTFCSREISARTVPPLSPFGLRCEMAVVFVSRYHEVTKCDLQYLSASEGKTNIHGNIYTRNVLLKSKHTQTLLEVISLAARNIKEIQFYW